MAKIQQPASASASASRRAAGRRGGHVRRDRVVRACPWGPVPERRLEQERGDEREDGAEPQAGGGDRRREGGEAEQREGGGAARAGGGEGAGEGERGGGGEQLADGVAEGEAGLGEREREGEGERAGQGGGAEREAERARQPDREGDERARGDRPRESDRRRVAGPRERLRPQGVGQPRRADQPGQGRAELGLGPLERAQLALRPQAVGGVAGDQEGRRDRPGDQRRRGDRAQGRGRVGRQGAGVYSVLRSGRSRGDLRRVRPGGWRRGTSSILRRMVLPRPVFVRRLVAAAALGLAVLVPGASPVAAAPAEAAAKKAAAFDYKVAMDDPHHHEFQVELSFSDIPGDTVDLQLPKWNPGAYKLTEAHRNLRGMIAESGGGKPISVVKIDEITWRVTHGGQPFKVRYRVYRGSYSGIGGAFLDDEFGFFNGVYVFLYAVGHKDRPIELRVDPLPGAQVVCGLPKTGGGRTTFRAADYDELVDSPVHVGKVDTVGFKVGKVDFKVALQGLGNYSDKKLVGDLTKIAEQAFAVFGGGDDAAPFSDYTFIVHLRPGARGGLEHRNSTVVGSDPWVFGEPTQYRRFLSLAAHEFFHAWNVKRIRPGVLGPFAYEREVHTSMLWFSEGFTSYYAWLLMARAGLASEAEAMESLAGVIRTLQESPGRRMMTVEQASWEAWLKPEDAGNSYVDFYTKGQLIALALDLELRKISGGQRSLDSVMRDLYVRWQKTGAGLTPPELEQTFVVAGGAAGSEISEMFRRYVHGFDEIEYARHLGLAGYRYEATPEAGGDLEVVFADNGDKATIELVRVGGPGDKAGLANGDVLVAIDGLKLANAAEAQRQIKAMAPGSRHQVTLARGARVIERNVVAGSGGSIKYKISLDPGATYEQLALRQQWLGYTAPAKGEGGNSSLRDAALKLFKQDPTAGADPEDASVVVMPAGSGKGGKKKSGGKKPKEKAPAK